jgi:tRNA(fMet)-specific endonuclease VapC
VLVLDTDHFVEYEKGTSSESPGLKERLRQSGDAFAITVITVEEVIRGWMARVRRDQDPFDQIRGYHKLQQTIRAFATWKVLDWNETSVERFKDLRADRIRVGTMDLKIASVALANRAKLLMRNSKDFDKVPGLLIENWLS